MPKLSTFYHALLNHTIHIHTQESFYILSLLFSLTHFTTCFSNTLRLSTTTDKLKISEQSPLRLTCFLLIYEAGAHGIASGSWEIKSLPQNCPNSGKTDPRKPTNYKKIMVRCATVEKRTTLNKHIVTTTVGESGDLVLNSARNWKPV